MSSISLGTGPIVPRALPAWMMSCANSNVVRDDAKWQKGKRGGRRKGRGETERSKTRATLAEEAAASRLFFWPVPVGFESKTPTSAGTGGQSSMFKHHPRKSREISSLWITDRHSLLLMSAPIPEREQCARLVWAECERLWDNVTVRNTNDSLCTVCLCHCHLSWEV